jgi:hypothetical protein
MRIQLPSRLTYEQQCEVTIKAGMLDEAILIMVVDKSATIGVNSYTRFGSLSG